MKKGRPTTSNRKPRSGSVLIACLIWLVIWQAAAMAMASKLLLPGPLDTLAALAGLPARQEFWLNVGWTVFRCLFAMILSFVAGTIGAALAYKSGAARSFLQIPVSFFKAVPVMAIIIYVILLADSNWVGVIACFFMCFPVVYTNLLEGLDAMGDQLLEVADIYDLTGWQRLQYVYAPGLLGSIKAALSLIAGLSWKSVVAAEVLSIPDYSLGYQMINAKYYLETPELFAYIAVIVALSVAFEKLIKKGLARIEWRGYRGSRLFRSAEAAARSLSGGATAARTDTGRTALTQPPATAPTVTIRGLSKAFDDKSVLDDMDLTLEAGKVTALMGPSGQGKTTLARILTGLEAADGGAVMGIETATISYLFQEDRLYPWLNVYDNMALGLLNRGADVDGRIRQLAEALELTDALWQLPEELSGGMRYRAAMGRALAPQADFLILDEPFRGLDAALKQRIIDRLWTAETAGRTVLLITHSEDDGQQLADRKIKL